MCCVGVLRPGEKAPQVLGAHSGGREPWGPELKAGFGWPVGAEAAAKPVAPVKGAP